MITSMRGCVARNDLWTWPISSRSFSCDFAIKLLKYVTSCHVCLTTQTVLARCLFHGLHIYDTIQPMRGRRVAYHFQVNRSKVKVTLVVHIFAVGAGGILVDHRSTISSSHYYHYHHHHHRRRRRDYHYHYHYHYCFCRALLNPMISWLLECVSTSIPGTFPDRLLITMISNIGMCIQVESRHDWLTHCGHVMPYGGIVQEPKWGPGKVWEYKVLWLILNLKVYWKKLSLVATTATLGNLFLFA